MEALKIEHCPSPKPVSTGKGIGGGSSSANIIAFIKINETDDIIVYKPTSSKEEVLKDKRPIFANSFSVAEEKLKAIYKVKHPALTRVEAKEGRYSDDIITVFKKARIHYNVTPTILASFLQKYGPHPNNARNYGWSSIRCVHTGTASYPDREDIRNYGIYLRKRKGKTPLLVYDPKIAARQLKSLEERRLKMSQSNQTYHETFQTTVTRTDIAMIASALCNKIIKKSKDTWDYKHDIKAGYYLKYDKGRFLMFMIDMFVHMFGNYSYRRHSKFQEFKKLWKTHIKIVQKDDKIPKKLKSFMQNEITKRAPAKSKMDKFEIQKRSIFYEKKISDKA